MNNKTDFETVAKDAIGKVRCLLGYLEFLESKRPFLPPLGQDEIALVIKEANEWLREIES